MQKKLTIVEFSSELTEILDYLDRPNKLQNRLICIGEKMTKLADNRLGRIHKQEKISYESRSFGLRFATVKNFTGFW